MCWYMIFQISKQDGHMCPSFQLPKTIEFQDRTTSSWVENDLIAHGRDVKKRTFCSVQCIIFAGLCGIKIYTLIQSNVFGGLDTISSNGSSSQCCGLMSVSSQAISNLSKPISCKNILILHRLYVVTLISCP